MKSYKLEYICILMVTLLFTSVNYAQNSDQTMKKLVKQRIQNNKITHNNAFIRIQVYNGLSESKANDTKKQFDTTFPEYASELVYNSPEWKVQAGWFSSEIESFRALEMIRREFPGALKLKIK